MRLVMLLVCGVLVGAQTVPDRAVLGVLQRAAPKVKTTIVHRATVTPPLDLVFAATSELFTRLDGTGFDWSGDKVLGIFLQDRANPNLVFTVTLAPGTPDCFGRVERATATDAVITCTAEKVSMNPSQKFVYDVRAKALVRRIEFQPVSFTHVFTERQRAVIAGARGEEPLAMDYVPGRQPEFQILSTAAAQPWIVRAANTKNGAPTRFGPSGAFALVDELSAGTGDRPMVIESRGLQFIRHPLPESTYDEFASARPGRVKDGYVRGVEFDEQIGPHQVFENKLWFGKTFYDGEGHTGVGGFGYFDPGTASYVLFRPPEIQDMSVSAILVERDAVWLALIFQGEYGGSGGGVLRFDRATQICTRFETPGQVTQIIRMGDRLLLTNHLGLDVIDAAGIKRYFVDKTTDGRLRIAQAER